MCNKKEKHPVMGFEKEVTKLRTSLSFLNMYGKEVDEQKVFFRLHASDIAKRTGHDVRSLEFFDSDGKAIVVSLPDPEASGNRLNLSGEKLAKANGIAGLEDFLETVVSYELTGEWVAWLESTLDTWEKQGVAMPEGMKKKSVTRLTADGVKKLSAVSDTNQIAKDLLESALRTPTVGMGK